MLVRWIRFLKEMGPAWVISAVACGPATLASVSIAGATYSYAMLWVVVLSAVFGTTAQYLAAKIGIIENRGIIATTEARLGRTWAWILTLYALLATWLAAVVLMNALAGVTSLITGINTPYWGIPYGMLIGSFLVWRGYRWFETACKLLVVFVVTCFMATLFMADISLLGIVNGLVPTIPDDVHSAMMMAAIMGGAVHITIIGMHTYNTNAKGWNRDNLGLARIDTILSMGIAFGSYSIAIFIVAAAVLHPNNVEVKTATDAALALKPLLGDRATQIFLLGIWGAALSTISPTFMAGAYFLSDKLKWQLNVKHKGFAAVVFTGCTLSMLGPFIKGSFFLLLPLMLALGLTGTPLILGIIIYLLNKQEIVGKDCNKPVLNILGGLAFMVTAFLAIRFVLTHIS
jgi:manganese transport protein